ncbi:MAG: hypothetical protein AB7U29_19810 [Desulfobulbus sp.]
MQNNGVATILQGELYRENPLKLNGVQGAGGSNPLVPTSNIKGLDAFFERLSPFFVRNPVFSMLLAGFPS